MRLLRLEISNFAPLRLFDFRMPIIKITVLRANSPGLLCFCFTSPIQSSHKTAPLPVPIRCKTETNYVLVARVFTRFRQFSWWILCSYCVLKVYSFLLIGRSNYYSFGQFLRELIKKRSSPHIINRDYSIFLRLSPAHLKRPSN